MSQLCNATVQNNGIDASNWRDKEGKIRIMEREKERERERQCERLRERDSVVGQRDVCTLRTYIHMLLV